MHVKGVKGTLHAARFFHLCDISRFFCGISHLTSLFGLHLSHLPASFLPPPHSLLCPSTFHLSVPIPPSRARSLSFRSLPPFGFPRFFHPLCIAQRARFSASPPRSRPPNAAPPRTPPPPSAHAFQARRNKNAWQSWPPMREQIC